MSIPKSFITEDVAFRKDLTLQGCTMFTTRTSRLLLPHDTLSGVLAEGSWPRPLPRLIISHGSSIRGMWRHYARLPSRDSPHYSVTWINIRVRPSLDPCQALFFLKHFDPDANEKTNYVFHGIGPNKLVGQARFRSHAWKYTQFWFKRQELMVLGRQERDKPPQTPVASHPLPF